MTKRSEFAHDLDLHVYDANEPYVKSNVLTITEDHHHTKTMKIASNKKTVKRIATVELLSNCEWLQSNEFGE